MATNIPTFRGCRPVTRSTDQQAAANSVGGMGAWDRIRNAFRSEKREIDDIVGDATKRADAALDRRERELDASPAEKLAMEQQRTEEIDSEFDAVRKRIEGGPSK